MGPGRCASRSASTAAYLPLLIHTLATARSKRAAVAMIVRQLMAAGLVSSGRNAVIGYPIRCAEPWARLRPGQIQGTTGKARLAGGGTCAR